MRQFLDKMELKSNNALISLGYSTEAISGSNNYLLLLAFISLLYVMIDNHL